MGRSSLGGPLSCYVGCCSGCSFSVCGCCVDCDCVFLVGFWLSCVLEVVVVVVVGRF